MKGEAKSMPGEDGEALEAEYSGAWAGAGAGEEVVTRIRVELNKSEINLVLAKQVLVKSSKKMPIK